jgi:hypothetical protein
VDGKEKREKKSSPFFQPQQKQSFLLLLYFSSWREEMLSLSMLISMHAWLHDWICKFPQICLVACPYISCLKHTWPTRQP